MSFYAVVDDEKETGADVATNSGWTTFSAWVKRNPELEELNLLITRGWSDNFKLLVKELLKVAGSKEVQSVSVALLQVLKEQSGGEVLILTDGVGVTDAKA